jgi:SAM-dependent methyltransferase
MFHRQRAPKGDTAMDTRDRCLLDLQGVLKLPAAPSQPHYAPLESRYLKFKDTVQSRLKTALGQEGCRKFLERYFIEFLPTMLRAAAEHEKLDQVSCDDERAMLRELQLSERGFLSHSPMLFPLNRKAFQQVPDGSPALDLGIGTGQNSRFTHRGRDLSVGGDVIVSNLLGARTRCTHKSFCALDMGHLPFLDGAFERVYALNCIYHASGGRRRTLDEMTRVLAPGGILALTDSSVYLNSLKPLASFWQMLGFEDVAQAFEGYFLSGYGADGSPGDVTWYREQLSHLGFEDIHIEYIVSPRLTSIAYLFYDWQALFNLDAQACFAAPGGLAQLRATYEPMLMSVVAPLLKLDRELCQQAQRGGYIFVSARKRGTSTKSAHDLSWACPACRVPLSDSLACGQCARNYPAVQGIPLLTTFYADDLNGSIATQARAG